mgnify:CR=1 FL=1
MVVVYITSWSWPLTSLTPLGLATRLVSGSPDHLGLLFVECSDEQVEAHSDPQISKPSARGAKRVYFDYISREMTFHGRTRTSFFRPSRYEQLAIFGVNAAAIHTICVRMAKANPYNAPEFRLNPLCFPCSSLVIGSSRTDGAVGPTHCSASILRSIAYGADQSDEMLRDDALVMRMLRFSEADRRVCFGQRQRLVSFSPRRTLRLLKRHAWVPHQGRTSLDEELPLISLSLTHPHR